MVMLGCVLPFKIDELPTPPKLIHGVNFERILLHLLKISKMLWAGGGFVGFILTNFYC
jgi:hypothetical protein